MTAATPGPGVKTVIPPTRRGEGLLPPRPEPDGREDREARDEVRQVEEQGRRRSTSRAGSTRTRGVTEGPLADAVKRSMKFAFKREPVFVREGGSIGAVVTMEKVLKVPGHLPRPLAAGARLPRPERELRLGAGLRRHGVVRPLLRRGRLARKALEDREARPAPGEARGEEGPREEGEAREEGEEVEPASRDRASRHHESPREERGLSFSTDREGPGEGDRESTSRSRRFLGGRGRAVRPAAACCARPTRFRIRCGRAGGTAELLASLVKQRRRLIPARSSRIRAGPRPCSRAARETHRPARGRRASASRRGSRGGLSEPTLAVECSRFRAPGRG